MPETAGSAGQDRITDSAAERRYIGRYDTREEAERVSATYGDSLYPNRTVEPEEVGRRVDWLISKGFLSQPLPFGLVLHLARGSGYASASLGRKTPTYPDLPQYHRRGLLIRWEVTTSDT